MPTLLWIFGILLLSINFSDIERILIFKLSFVVFFSLGSG